jgi:multicomponent Na+:H+ antiporter subunit E
MEPKPAATMRPSLELISVLFAFWVLLNGSLAVDVLVVGALVAVAIAMLFRGGLSFLADARLTPASAVATFMYFGHFAAELVRANLRLAVIVLSPELPIRPGIVKVRTRLKSPMGRLLLANSISLTPGTLTIEMEGEWLYVHCVTVEHTDADENGGAKVGHGSGGISLLRAAE